MNDGNVLLSTVHKPKNTQTSEQSKSEKVTLLQYKRQKLLQIDKYT